MTQYQYIYLHGFASSPLSKKAQYLEDKFQQKGIKLNLIDLNKEDFTHLTLTRQINQVSNYFLLNKETKIRIIGSSFGGLTTAWLAQKYTQIESIVLLAPAFNFQNNWLPKLGQETLNQWQKTGYISVFHYGENKEIPLHYHFLEDLTQYEDSQLNHSIPTLIFHGKFDETIPIISSRQYAKTRSNVELVELESDHSLTNVMSEIWIHIEKFLQI